LHSPLHLSIECKRVNKRRNEERERERKIIENSELYSFYIYIY
jgi:hypothetical protein